MTNLSGHDDVRFHVGRAEQLLDEMELIQGASSTWSMVVAFYSAYHSVKAAMLEDPVFDDASLLASANVHLSMSSRNASHHNGHPSSARGPGVNDIVRYLYRPYYSRYFQLHSASVAVRYGIAKSAITVDQCLLSAHELYAALQNGKLVFAGK